MEIKSFSERPSGHRHVLVATYQPKDENGSFGVVQEVQFAFFGNPRAPEAALKALVRTYFASKYAPDQDQVLTARLVSL